MSNSILLTPGPVQLHPKVQEILSVPMIHHRTPQFTSILKSALDQLKLLFKTSQPCFMLTGTGTAGMESLLVNTLKKGDKVLAIVSGKFGERWAKMAAVYGAEVIELKVDWGQPVLVEDVKKAFSQHPDIQIVLCQACETSTATTHPIQQLGQLIQSTRALFLVDGITALGAYPLPMDDWHIDGLVGGSQKAFMLPTGMSYVSFSKKAWDKINSNEAIASFYLDIKKEHAANQKGETYFSSQVQLIRALDLVLQMILEKGINTHYAEIHARSEYTRKMADVLNLKVYSAAPSDSVTALLLPENLDGSKLRDHIENKYDLILMGGQDHLKGKILRIGHMGYITTDDLHQSSLRLAQALNDFKHSVNIETVKENSRQLIQKLFKTERGL